jgi:hypothetical protein
MPIGGKKMLERKRLAKARRSWHASRGDFYDLSQPLNVRISFTGLRGPTLQLSKALKTHADAAN